MGSSLFYQREHDFVGLKNRVMAKVYGFMFSGILTTALTSLAVSHLPGVIGCLFNNVAIYMGICIAELVLILTISALLRNDYSRISFPMAVVMFLTYSVLNGFTLTPLLMTYADTTCSAFFITSTVFASMTIVGYSTKRDLTSMSSFLIFALLGVAVAGFVNIFTRSSFLNFAVSSGMVLVFLGLTAYDTQKIKYSILQARDESTIRRISLYGALELYLNFINIFIHILRLLANRRDRD